MIHSGDRAALALEAGAKTRILPNRGRQNLDRDRAIELRVVRSIHRGHAAFAEGCFQSIFAELAADELAHSNLLEATIYFPHFPWCLRLAN